MKYIYFMIALALCPLKHSQLMNGTCEQLSLLTTPSRLNQAFLQCLLHGDGSNASACADLCAP